jgi:CBS domain-containing protein
MVIVSDLMTKDVITLDINDPIKKLLKVMSAHNVSCVVITRAEKPVGLITERDLIKKILLPGKDSKTLKLKDIMAKTLIGIDPKVDLGKASQTLEQKKIRHLPVIDGDKLVGLITQTDIVSQTQTIHKKNKNFMMYQNIQTAVIVIFFLYVIIYFAFKFLF